MWDIKVLPSSVAEKLIDEQLSFNNIKFSSTENIDGHIYEKSNNRLIKLEQSLKVNEKKLQQINSLVDKIKTSINKKEEILLRINWLTRLYKVKGKIEKTETIEEVRQLERLLTSVQTCPLKKQLLNEIKRIKKLLPIKDELLKEEDQLMERAINDIGNRFINLGKVGRKFIIESALKQYGKQVSTKRIISLLEQLEQQVDLLFTIEGKNEMMTKLNELPIQHFNHLNREHQKLIVEQLMVNKNWNGLAALDRQIKHLDKTITKELEEAKKTNESADHKGDTVLNMNSSAKGIVK